MPLEEEIEKATPEELHTALAKKYPISSKPMKRGIVRMVIKIPLTVRQPEKVEAAPAPVDPLPGKPGDPLRQLLAKSGRAGRSRGRG